MSMIFLPQLVRKEDIKRLLGCGYKVANKYFKSTKALDNDPYDIRPTQVPLKLFCKTHGFDYKLAVETLKEIQAEMKGAKNVD